MTKRKMKKTELGVVTSDKMQKTIIVKIERRVRHPQFGKFINRFTTFKAHDENEQAQVGDLVEIAETKPYSKTKKFRLIRVVKKSNLIKEQIAAIPSADGILKTAESSQGDVQL